MIDVRVYALFYRGRLALSRYFERGSNGMVVRGPVGTEEGGFGFDGGPSAVGVVFLAIEPVESSEGGVAESGVGGGVAVDVSMEINKAFLR